MSDRGPPAWSYIDLLSSLALTIAEGIHEFLKLGASLDLEKDFIIAIRHFDVEMFCWLWSLGRGTVW